MVMFWWVTAFLLTLAGALLYWGAGALALPRLYRQAGLLLLSALLGLGLARLWPWWFAWLGT